LFKNISIIGLGLIGGSLGQRIITKLPGTKVTGIPRRKATIKQALAKKAIQKGTLDIKEGIKNADLIIIATPIQSIVPIFKKVISHAKKDTVIIDVGSTKTALVHNLEALCPSHLHFIGCHPMAGKETKGIEVAEHKILDKATVVLTKTGNTSKKALNALTLLFSKLGTKPLTMKPQLHDYLVGAVSHLPYLLASSLAGTVKDMKNHKKTLSQLASSGFRDTTRVASSDPDWGKDIVETNREQLLLVLEQYQKNLENLQKMIKKRNYAGVKKVFTQNKLFRDSLY
jgi:prephenate dehydrogenase